MPWAQTKRVLPDLEALPGCVDTLFWLRFVKGSTLFLKSQQLRFNESCRLSGGFT